MLASLALGILMWTGTAHATPPTADRFDGGSSFATADTIQVDTIQVPRAIATGGIQIRVLVDGDTVSTHAQLHVAISELFRQMALCPSCTVEIDHRQAYRGEWRTEIIELEEPVAPDPPDEPDPPEEPEEPDPPEDPDPVDPDPIDPEEPEPPPTLEASPRIYWGAPYPADGPYPLLVDWAAVEGVDGYRISYGPQGGEVDVTEPTYATEVAVEVGWLCVRTFRATEGDPVLSGQRCNSYPSNPPHNELEFIHNSAADSLTLEVGETDRFVVIRWWNARMTVPVILPSGDRGWIEVEQVTDGEAHALRTVPGGIWRPDPEAMISMTSLDPEVATVDDILYTLAADPALGPVVVVEWGEVVEPTWYRIGMATWEGG